MKLYLDTSTENTILRLDEKEYSAPLKNQLAFYANKVFH